MTDQLRSNRPKRCSTRRNPEAFLYALSWQEERDIQRAMYKSLKDRRSAPELTTPVIPNSSPTSIEPAKVEPTRKSPRGRIPTRHDGFDDEYRSRQFSKASKHDGGTRKEKDTTSNSTESVGVKTRQQYKPNRPLLMRASSSSVLEENSSNHTKTDTTPTPQEHAVVKKRILAPRRSMGEIPVELWVDPTGKPVVTRDFLDFLCFRGSPRLPSKLAWFDLAPHKRPQVQLYTTGSRGASIARPKVSARDKRTSISGGLISDSSSNSGGLSRRNSGQSSPSGEDNTTANGERRPSSRDAMRPRKKSRSLFYQIMTAKLRRLQNINIGGKRTSKSPVPSPPAPPPPPPPQSAMTKQTKKNEVKKKKPIRKTSIVRSRTGGASRAVLRRSHRVQQQRQSQDQQRRERRQRRNPVILKEEDSEEKELRKSVGDQRKTNQATSNGTSNKMASKLFVRAMVTRQRAKNNSLRANIMR